MDTELFENLGDLTRLPPTDAAVLVGASLRSYRGDDPNQEAPVSGIRRKTGAGLLSWGGICHSKAPRLMLDWTSRYPAGYSFADDLLSDGLGSLQEALDLLTSGDTLAAQAKLECSLAVLDHMPKKAAMSAAGLKRRLRAGVNLLRRQRPFEARDLLGTLAKKIV
jgi:hypothetical protein